MVYESCPLTSIYFNQLTTKTQSLLKPDLSKKTSESENAKKLIEVRKWFDLNGINYKVTKVKKMIYQGFSADEILISLPETDRSSRVSFTNTFVENIGEFCLAHCGAKPGEATIKKWLRGADPYKKIRRYVERTNKETFSGRVSDFIQLPIGDVD